MRLLCLASLVLALLTTNTAQARGGVAAQAIANPLLRGATLPLYAEITHEHVAEAVQHLVALTEEKIAEIEQDEATDFDSLFEKLGEIDINYIRIWEPLNHLHSVRKDDKKLLEAYEEAEPQVVQLGLQLAQNSAIYRKLQTLEQDDSLSPVQQHLVQLKLTEAQKLGIGLQGTERERFNAIKEELSKLQTDFANNVFKATKAFQLILHDKSDIAGLPASILARAAQNYEQQKKKAASAEEGPWLITLDYPSYKSFMDFSERRDLREEVYRAYISIAAQKPHDNTSLIQRTLQLRQEQAKLLGFPHHAASVLSTQMAGNVDNAKQLLDELHADGYPNMLKEREQLNAYAATKGGPAELARWDVSYWERKLKEEQLDLSVEKLREYFPLPKVLDGLFGLLSKMFGISIKESPTEVQVWHDDVKFYDVHDADGTHIASFYFDPYSRPQNKRSGAWMSDCNPRQVRGGNVEMPVCHVVANFTPPTGDIPALLNTREVTTLFHEFGHAMHELLTTVDYRDIAGTNVERDAVEMPSKFIEKFFFLDPVITTISAHVKSGKPLPAEMLARLQELKNFRSATPLQRQIFYSAIDLHLHSNFNPDTQDPLVLMREIHEQVLAMPPLDEDYFLNSFLHIFAGGYHANYYSYKWGEVLAADVFAMFVENGLDDEGLQHSGRMFRDIVLAAGGSKPTREIFLDLRGRMPSARELLKSYGLVEE